MFRRTLATTTLLLAAVSPRAADFERFEKVIRPALVEHCLECHGAEKQKGGLRLDSRAGWMTGGDSGPAIVPGHPDESLLFKAISYQSVDTEMPPKGRLPDAVIRAFEQWIAEGAPDPREGAVVAREKDGPTVEEGRRFWSFQPVAKPEPPAVKNAAWIRDDGDRFVLRRLEEAGLAPAPEAGPAALVRRLFLDLVGLPPTSERLEAILRNWSDNRYAALVDELLASPQFGERWGRHWLDVARFAESSGGGRTLLFPDAWRYRDYVIDAFNDDLPYDHFVREQLAGDLLPAAAPRERGRRVTATAFLVLGPTNYELQDKEVLEMDIIDEQLDIMGKAFMGMTIGCARCHDHKFDPIETRDYYAMAGILKSTRFVEHSNVSKWSETDLPLPDDQEAEFASREQELGSLSEELAALEAEAKKLRPGTRVRKRDAKSVAAAALPGIVVDDNDAVFTGEWKQSTFSGLYVDDGYSHDANEGKGLKTATFIPVLPRPGAYEVQLAWTPFENRSSGTPVTIHHAGGTTERMVNQKAVPPIDGHRVSLGKFRFSADGTEKAVIANDGTDGTVIADAVLFIPLAAEVAEIPPLPKPEDGEEKRQRLAEVEERIAELKPRVTKLRKRVDNRPKAMAVREGDTIGDIPLAIRGVTHNKGAITPRGVMRVATIGDAPTIPADASGRRELADWLASPRHPLTARVMVNRVWHWLFGRGIVRTVDNFGMKGAPPTHPDLLDHLAASFIADGWSVKRLIRRITLSSAYRMGSGDNAEARRVDPENDLFWRRERRRLDAEAIRDSLLFVSGELDETRGGNNIKAGTRIEYGYRFETARRSVYVPVFRNTLPEIFATFDFADPNIQVGRRATSTIAPQALLMMNSPFVIERSRAAAARLLEHDETAAPERVRRVHLQVIGREPLPKELTSALRFIGAGDDVERWALLYQTLFATIDFRYLD